MTRLRSLAEVERVRRGRDPAGGVGVLRRRRAAGAGYATAGHLLVVVGFDAAGDVVCNDPASHERPSNDEVRVVYPRGPFERVWMRSGGLVYVIHPPDVPLPAAGRSRPSPTGERPPNHPFPRRVAHEVASR